MKKKLNPKIIKLTTENRLYHLNIPIIAITGGIATGKSTVSKLISAMGFKVIDADSLVKKIYSDDETISFIKTIAPECIDGEFKIIFPKLREYFFQTQILKLK